MLWLFGMGVPPYGPCLRSDLRPKYMTPLEVEVMMKELWALEAPLLAYVFGSGTAADGDGAQDPAAVRALASAGADGVNGYKMFFIRVLPVAPNKFRPPSKVGEEMFEHPQNVALGRVLTAALDMATDAPVKLPDAAPGTGPDLAALRAAHLGRMVGNWLKLQDAVAALMDSTLAENNAGGGQGIRQALEKKEGLFRKNMMGKRVNFAARWVQGGAHGGAGMGCRCW